VQRLGAEFGRRPVGTGPFRFVNWAVGEEITLEANEAYYEGRPFLDRLHYRIMPNHQTILAEFEKGILEDVDLRGQEDTPLSRDPRFRFVRKPLLATVFLWLDTRHSPLDNSKVRQASIMPSTERLLAVAFGKIATCGRAVFSHLACRDRIQTCQDIRMIPHVPATARRGWLSRGRTCRH
jgi:ABC-type oligopeptide transport system substrate-binding subunit